MIRALILLLLWLPIQNGWAHHSYAEYDRYERHELRGTIEEIHWANPHIVFILKTKTERVEIDWITVTGAERTGVYKKQFTIGDEMVVIGSRHRNPKSLIMTVIKELHVPAKNLSWINPASNLYPVKEAP
jgi:Family of unknown function (DUF6152)